jgi:serine/threonine protein kinase/tetratricopeptide (TPR) repeat protein
MTDSSHDRDPIERLADSFLVRFRAGERPSVEEYAAKHPELADEIRELLPALVELEQNLAPEGTSTQSKTGRSGRGSSTPPRQLGDYLILREVGRGGMGVVYEATQQSLGRHVALKVMPAGSLSGSSQLQRFRLEARAAARLHHTNIVPVFGVGEQDGVHYYAMQFIQGQSLDAIIEELKRLRKPDQTALPTEAHRVAATEAASPALTRAVTQGLLSGRFAFPAVDSESNNVVAPGQATTAADTQAGTDGATVHTVSLLDSEHTSDATPRGAASGGSELSSASSETNYYRGVAQVGLQVAEALAHAHSEGILHRDIKPSNLLLDARGTVWVTDFGLAKAEESEGLTQTGDVVGTLRYMAPERFDGWSDPRSDLYAVGATLYELLTLKPLFDESNRAKLIERVLHDSPLSPRKLDRRIPRDLETIVLKAVAKEPASRYTTAEQMADDLRRFLADKPILARRITTTERAWRWCRRNPLPAGLASAAVLIFLAGFALVTAQMIRAERLYELAEMQRRDADHLRIQSETRRRLAEANFAKAQAAVDDYLTKVSESQLLDVPGLQPLRHDLLRSALRFYEGFLQERRGDPSLRAGLASAHLRVARIDGELGDGERAKQEYREAARLFEEALQEKTDDLDLRQGLARSLCGLGSFLGVSGGGQAALLRSITLQENLAHQDPSNVPIRSELGNAYNMMAIISGNNNKIDDSLMWHRRALEVREAIAEKHPESASLRKALGQTLNNIGSLLSMKGRAGDASAMYRRAVEHGKAAVLEEPHVLEHRESLGVFLHNLAASLVRLGRRDEAKQTYHEAIDVQKRLVSENPAVRSYRNQLYDTYLGLASLERELGLSAEASATLAMARDQIEALPRKTSGDLYNLACARAICAAVPAEETGQALTLLEEERGRQADTAIDALRQAIEAGWSDLDHTRKDRDLDALRSRADFQGLLAKMERAAKVRAVNAERAALDRKAAQVGEPFDDVRRQADLAAGQHALGLLLVDLGRFQEAAQSLEKARLTRQRLAKANPDDVERQRDLAASESAEGSLAVRTGRMADALKFWELGIVRRRALVRAHPNEPRFTDEVQDEAGALAYRLAEVGLWRESAAAFDEAFRREPTDVNSWHRHVVVLAALGDDEARRRLCVRMANRFQNWTSSGNPDLYADLSQAFTIGPGKLPGLDPELPLRWAEKVVSARPARAWAQFSLALAEYRSNRFDQALPPALEAARELAWISFNAGQQLPLLALIHHRLGHGDLARQWLEETEGRIELNAQKILGAPVGRLPFNTWFDWAEFLALLREARRLIPSSSLAENPFELLAQARMNAALGRAEQAETEFAGAVAARPDDARVWIARARCRTEVGQRDPAEADLTKARSLAADDARAWVALGRLLAEQGKSRDAEAAFARALKLKPTDTQMWVDAGWWYVGPYPEDLTAAFPPESDPDPARSVNAAEIAPGTAPDALRWRSTPTGPNGLVNLTGLFPQKDWISTYALAYVYAPKPRTVTLSLGSDDQLRVWLNGKLVHQRSDPVVTGPDHDRVTVTLRPGRNTLLAKVVNVKGPCLLHLRFVE